MNGIANGIDYTSTDTKELEGAVHLAMETGDVERLKALCTELLSEYKKLFKQHIHILKVVDQLGRDGDEREETETYFLT